MNHSKEQRLLSASIYGHLEIVEELLSTGMDPNIINEGNGTPLFLASFHGHFKIVKMLLEHGADPNITNKYNETSLIWPSRYGRLEVVRILLEYGADPNIVDVDNTLAWTSDNKHLNVIELLKNYFPSLHTLSIRSIRKHKIDITSLPPVLLESQ